MSKQRTLSTVRTVVCGAAPIEILGPNPRRKSFLLSPVAAGPGSAQAVIAVPFVVGLAQTWQVPAGVTGVVDAYAWGAGGNPGAPGAILGGGGGGGGGFAATGPLPVIPGAVYTIDVRAGGGGSSTTFTDPLGSTLISSDSGSNGANDASGSGGNGAGPGITTDGGEGADATALAGAGGGGGGAAGNLGDGSPGAGQAGGAGGGSPMILGYGTGGTGGSGGSAGIVGLPGSSPGAGGGGSGANGPAAPAGSDGLIVVFYVAAIAQQAVSLSPRADVVPGQGAINYLPGQTFPTVLCDDDIGSVIGEPWYIVSGVEGVVVQIVEYTYVDCDPAF